MSTTAQPDWLVALAEEVARTSQTAAAKRIGYTSSVVSQALNGVYKADLKSVEAAVRGALMGATVDCPVAGDLAKDRCLRQQKMPMTGASPMRMQFARACPLCPHSRQRADK